MFFVSRKKRIELDERTKTLKDVRERKHVLGLFIKPIDEAEHHFCFLSFSCIYKSNATEDFKTIKEKFDIERKEGSTDNYTIVNNKDKKYFKYLGESKPKNLPINYETFLLDWNKLIEAIHCMLVTPKGIHFGAIYFLIKKGLFGTGYENMKQSDYRKKMKESGFIKSIGRENISYYIPNSFDYLCYSISISHFNEKEERLSEKDQKEIKKQNDLRSYCCELIDKYWHLMKQ